MLTVSMVTRRRTELLFLKEPAVELEFLIVAQSRITESLSLTMGIYSSTFHQSGGQLLLEFTDPSQANWITSHAEACQMTIPEVQRYWGRFVLLQPDRDGNVPLNRFLTKEIFSHQLLEQMPLTPDGLMTFQTFCNAVSWFSKASVETKLRALHQTLTFKSPLNQDALQPLLQDVYPSEPSETISQLSQLLMSEVDRKRQGYIDEDQFVEWIQRLPQDSVESILHFPVIPQEVTAASKDQTSNSSNGAARWGTLTVTDEQLLRVATEMSARKRDWKLLANNLGFLENESRAFEGRHPEVNQQILEMLQTWRRNAGSPTEISTLQSALRASGNTDISNEVFQLSF